MTREEEIKRAAKENASNLLEFEGFIKGAGWADKSMIKRVCEFIQNHHHEYSSWNTEECEEEFDTQKFIEDIRKIIQ